MLRLSCTPSRVVGALIAALEREEFIEDACLRQLPSAVWRRLKEKPSSYKYCKEEADILVYKMCELDFGLLFRICGLRLEDASKYRGIRTLKGNKGNQFYAELKRIYERMKADEKPDSSGEQMKLF